MRVRLWSLVGRKWQEGHRLWVLTPTSSQPIRWVRWLRQLFMKKYGQ
jgi:hypothetical protein